MESERISDSAHAIGVGLLIPFSRLLRASVTVSRFRAFFFAFPARLNRFMEIVRQKAFRQQIPNNMYYTCFGRAVRFYDGACFYLDTDETPELAVFLLLQSVELALYALAGVFEERLLPPYQIRRLKKCIVAHLPQLDQIFPEDSQEDKELLRLLEEAGERARYDTHFRIGEQDLALLFKRAVLLHLLAAEVLGELSAETEFKE